MQFRIRRSSPELVFFAPDVADHVTATRAEAFKDYGYNLTTFGFRRDRYDTANGPAGNCIMLGHTRDGRYAQRLLALIGALPKLLRHRRRIRVADIFYARNLDQLLLALLSCLLVRRRPRIIYEVLDVQPAFTGSGLTSRLLRAAERWALHHADMLVLSSPGFLKHYFLPVQRYRRPWFLLENKLPPGFAGYDRSGGTALGRRRQQRGGIRWVVAYCGLIRGQQTVDLIVRLAERLQGIVEFRFYGRVTTVDADRFHDATRRLENLVYCGPYTAARDLPAIYRSVDFAWGLDLENSEHNSRWLLPCRLYEAGFFGVPCLTAAGFEVGERVEDSKIGWSFDVPYERTLYDFFLNLDDTEYEEKRGRLLGMPENSFVGGEDAMELCRLIDGRKA